MIIKQIRNHNINININMYVYIYIYTYAAWSTILVISFPSLARFEFEKFRLANMLAISHNVVCTKEDCVVLLTSTAKPPFALCRDNI